ncbi:MAG: hypothetical protein N2690_05445, partial [Rhodocyclaceae bacterium]|nr:hypothetical protein [Rhodocyclaceae bacterium]
EHLPFEADPITAMHQVRSLLASGLLSGEARDALWAKAQRRPHYLIGFLEYLPEALPGEAALPPIADLPDTPAARLWARCRSASGQAWLAAAERALERPPAHEAVYLLLDLIGRHFAAGRDALRELADYPRAAAALAALSRLSNADAEPILTRTTAVGPLLRRHLEPLIRPIIEHMRSLRGRT